MIKDEMLGPATREEKGKRKKEKGKRKKKKESRPRNFSTMVLGNAIEHPNTQISIHISKEPPIMQARKTWKQKATALLLLL